MSTNTTSTRRHVRALIKASRREARSARWRGIWTRLAGAALSSRPALPQIPVPVRIASGSLR